MEAPRCDATAPARRGGRPRVPLGTVSRGEHQGPSAGNGQRYYTRAGQYLDPTVNYGRDEHVEAHCQRYKVSCDRKERTRELYKWELLRRRVGGEAQKADATTGALRVGSPRGDGVRTTRRCRELYGWEVLHSDRAGETPQIGIRQLHPGCAREFTWNFASRVEPRCANARHVRDTKRSAYGLCECVWCYQKAPPEQGARPDREHDMVRSSRISRRGQSTTHQHVGDARQRGRLKSRSRYKRMSMVRSHQRKRSATTTFAPDNASLSHADEVGRDKTHPGARGMEVPGISSPTAITEIAGRRCKLPREPYHT